MAQTQSTRRFDIFFLEIPIIEFPFPKVKLNIIATRNINRLSNINEIVATNDSNRNNNNFLVFRRDKFIMIFNETVWKVN